jgi:hypothetical protein
MGKSSFDIKCLIASSLASSGTNFLNALQYSSRAVCRAFLMQQMQTHTHSVTQPQTITPRSVQKIKHILSCPRSSSLILPSCPFLFSSPCQLSFPSSLTFSPHIPRFTSLDRSQHRRSQALPQSQHLRPTSLIKPHNLLPRQAHNRLHQRILVLSRSLQRICSSLRRSLHGRRLIMLLLRRRRRILLLLLLMLRRYRRKPKRCWWHAVRKRRQALRRERSVLLSWLCVRGRLIRRHTLCWWLQHWLGLRDRRRHRSGTHGSLDELM